MTAAVLLAAGLLVLAVTKGYARRQPLQTLIENANAMETRSLVGRVEGVAYRPLEHPTRSAASTASLAQLRLLTTAAETLRERDVQQDAANGHAVGLAHLFSGKIDEAIRVLRDAAARPDASARIWNDLAAATLQRAALEGDPRESGNALAAANRALALDPRSASALYNRVLAFDGIGLEFAARDAAGRYLALDGGSEWSQELRERLRTWNTSTRSADWNKALPELERASEHGDIDAITAIVEQFPQQARSWGEGEFLGRWSDAVMARRADQAHRWLNAVRLIAYALVQFNGTGELRAIVDHLDAHEEPERVAAAFQVYRAGRMSLDRRRAAEAIPLLREAQGTFERTGSPLALLTGQYLAVALLDANQLEDSGRVLTALDASLRPEYRALRAQCDWHRTNLLARQGRHYEAHRAAQRALGEFERLREETNRARMASAVATTMSRLGLTQEAWRTRSGALRSAVRSGDTRAIEITLNSTIRQAIREKEWPIALALLDAQIERGISLARLRVEATLWRAFVIARMQGPGAAIDVQAAMRAALEVEDPGLRQDALADIRMTEAVIARDGNPARAIELLDEVIAWRERHGGPDMAVAYVERARAYRAIGRPETAMADLARATAIIEAQRGEIARDDIRDTFFGSSEDAYEEQIDLLLDQRDPGSGFMAAERMRARVVLDRLMGRTADVTAVLDAAAIRRLLPDGVRMVHFTVLPRRTFIVTFDRTGWNAAVVGVGRATIERLRGEFLQAIAASNDGAARVAGQQLYDILLSRVSIRDGEVLVVVPDETLAEIPFAALVNPAGQFLIEQTAVTAATSAAVFIRQSHDRPTADLHRGQAAVVGDPAFDSALFPGLPRLAAAAEEARRLAAMLPRSVPLTGADATRRQVLDAARNSTIVHIAAHAMTNRTNPSASFIVLAGSKADSGLLYHRDIASDDFRATHLVVLAGCRTAAASSAPGSVRSLAMAFIAAGTPNVLASLWDVDDAVTSELSLRFYRHLAAEPRPAAALRLAQLDMLRSAAAANRAIRGWSALQMYGSGL